MVDFCKKEQYGLEDMIALIHFLRSENGCPWDKVQTHRSIRRNLIEEAYEAAEAIDGEDLDHLKEELGDVLMQVLFHADIERDAGHFDLDDVADASCKKLVERHPFLFDTGTGESWEEIKSRQNGFSSVAENMDHVARTLPALWRGEKVLKKASAAGFDWRDSAGALEKVREETGELAAAMAEDGDVEEELGDLLLAAVHVALMRGVDPEQALTRATDKFIRRFAAVEQAAAQQGVDLKALSEEDLLALWRDAKST